MSATIIVFPNPPTGVVSLARSLEHRLGMVAHKHGHLVELRPSDKPRGALLQLFLDHITRPTGPEAA